MDLENAMRVINGVSGFTDDDTGVGMAWLVVTDHIESQAATIARLEAERDGLREACREALITIRMSTIGRIEKGLVEQLEAALSARQNNDAVNAAGGE